MHTDTYLQSRTANRGTGRTTKALQAAIDHAIAHGRFKIGRAPIAFLVVSNKEQWDYIKTIRKDLIGVMSQQRKLLFDGADILVRTPEDCERSMRGYDCPIIVDHSVLERRYDNKNMERDVNLLFHLYEHRLVMP